MSDSLIQKIDLDNIPHQAVDYGLGLQKYMVYHSLSTENLADIVCVEVEEIEHLIAGTSSEANSLACCLWIRGQIHVETMILSGSNFFGGDHADKVMVA